MEHLVHSHSEQVADIDPVCGMKVDPATSPHRYTHEGRSYFFCSAGCRNKFMADPGKYLSKADADQPPATPVPKETIYTCPMHPEVRQIGPGACPICGMALEPEAGGEHDGGELADMSRRLWISAVLALPVVVLEMDGHFGFAPLSHAGSSLVQLALATPVVLWGGWPFFVRGAQSLRTRPWSVTVGGAAEKTGTFTLEDILRPHALEERIYRLRCVEAWSMVIPWIGFPLGDLLRRFNPTSKAKFVEFTTLADARQMPGLQSDVLPWPYMEGLRIDEAMHPLAIMVVGVYGRALPNQNGAPLRTMVPWKYGFKNAKAIVRIRFTEGQPSNTWNSASPGEYGFYANVNPEVDHPRWSQATERRIGAGFFAQRQKTLLFNGYADEVASLYQGMNLHRYY